MATCNFLRRRSRNPQRPYRIDVGGVIVKMGGQNENLGANQHPSFGAYGWNVPWTVDCLESIDEDLWA